MVSIVNEYVSEKYDHDEYNWKHNEFVRKYALILAEKLGASKEIIEIAARLHDIDYSRGHEFHTQDSAKHAREFLIRHGFPKNKADIVHDSIMCHTGSILEGIKNPPLEGKILHDADKMWTMTPLGFSRLIAHRYKNKSTSYKYIIQKLKKALDKYDLLIFAESKALIKEYRLTCIDYLRVMIDEDHE